MIVDTLIGQMKFSGQVSTDRGFTRLRRACPPSFLCAVFMAEWRIGGPDLTFLVNSLGLPAVLFIRRLCGGLAGLPPNSFTAARNVKHFLHLRSLSWSYLLV